MTLPQGWTEASLAEACERIVDGSHNPPGGQTSGLPMLSARNIDNGEIAFDQFRLITAEAFEIEDRRSEIGPGTVLLTIVGALGRSAVVRPDHPKFTVQRSVGVLHPSEAIEPHFLSRLFDAAASQQWFLENARGTAQKGVYLKTLSGFSIDLPPLAEQRRIVAKLDALTARLTRARSELDRVSVLADHLRQSAVAHAFNGQLTTGWRAAHSGLAAFSITETEFAYVQVAGHKRRKPAFEIDWQPDMAIPDGWRWASVDELVAITQYGSSAKTSDDASGVPVLRMGNIQSGEVDWSSLKYLPLDHAEFPELFLQAGDVLFNRTNSFELVGKSAVFRGSARPVSYASYLIRLRCSAILPDLLVRYVNSQYGRAWIDQVASQQVGQANVNGSKLKALGVPLPPPAEQVEMLRLLDIAFARADRLEAEAARARALLDRLESALLAKAFRGELVPQDPNDEPAETLLDRIRTQRAAAPKAKRGRKAKISA